MEVPRVGPLRPNIGDRVAVAETCDQAPPSRRARLPSGASAAARAKQSGPRHENRRSDGEDAGFGPSKGFLPSKRKEGVSAHHKSKADTKKPNSFAQLL